MASVRFHPGAEEEAVQAAEWYERQQPGLGADFLRELARSVEILCDSPCLWPFWPGVRENQAIRRCILSRFPYAVAYGATDATIIIYAVAHLARRPRYWIDRTGS